MERDEVNYKELYLYMVRQTEKAIRLLADAQEHCEEEYLASFEDEPDR